jgi:hypothetical protein
VEQRAAVEQAADGVGYVGGDSDGGALTRESLAAGGANEPSRYCVPYGAKINSPAGIAATLRGS